MVRVNRLPVSFLVACVCLSMAGCALRRPNTAPSRMIEPQLLDSQPSSPDDAPSKSAQARSLRLLDTQARAHIGRSLLHRQENGELTYDGVWRWSSSPDRYLETALRLEIASRRDVRLVDSSGTSLAATLLEWDLDPASTPKLIAAAEFAVTEPNRSVRTRIVRLSEPTSAELPGDLAAVAGRLLRRLASEGVKFATSRGDAPEKHDAMK